MDIKSLDFNQAGGMIESRVLQKLGHDSIRVSERSPRGRAFLIINFALLQDTYKKKPSYEKIQTFEKKQEGPC